MNLPINLVVQVVWGYVENSDRKWMPYVLGIFTLGTFNLLLYWKPEMRLKLLYHRCVLPAAQRILIRVNRNLSTKRTFSGLLEQSKIFLVDL